MKERNIKTAVVTGPTGAIGTALCKLLLAQGLTVYAVCRPGSSRAAKLTDNEKLHIIYCDACELYKLPNMISEKADVFFHFAWVNTIGSGRNDMQSQIKNIQYTIDAVRVAAELECKVFVGAGSQAEYGRVEGIIHADTPAYPENGYGMAKLCAGQMSRVECKKLEIVHVWARILSVYGPHDGPNTMISGTIRKLLAGEKPLLTAGIQKWDYLYSDDAANALYCMAKAGHDGAVYPLGSGTARPLREYIEILRDTINPELPLGIGEIPYDPLQVMYLCADLAPLKHDTDFSVETSFEEGIKNTIDWIRNENN